MKTKIVIGCLVLMFLAFAGSALAGHETDTNTWFGKSAGNNASLTGIDNTFIGYATGTFNTTGQDNTFIGYVAGYNNISGAGNTYIGEGAGWYNTAGTKNVFLGYFAGYYETGSNKLYIANSNTDTPLIYGDFSSNTLTVNGNLGVGTKTPVRQLHLVGSNAVFRMDRTADTAAFMLVRTDASGNPQKTFVVGANSSGSGVGTFVINDLGTAVSGGGTNRMTINNDGSVTFTGNVYANAFVPSSMAYKDNIRTYDNALETVNKLRGVKFNWKDSGKPSVGLIAEEVEKVVPEVVAHNEGNATGVNYASLVGVLVEAFKEQEVKMQGQQAEMDSLKAEVQQLKALLQGRQ